MSSLSSSSSISQVVRMTEDSKFNEWLQAMHQEESVLLRELQLVMQGINGEHLHFQQRGASETNDDIHNKLIIRSDRVMANLPPSLLVRSKLTSGASDAIRICAEAGWLYTRITAYIRSVDENDSKGSVVRAFARALEEELQDYRKLLSSLDIATMTLGRTMSAMMRPISRLKTLALLTDGAMDQTGSNLLRTLHLRMEDGSSKQATVARSLLKKSARPWYEMLYRWIVDGVLTDSIGEFFISEDAKVHDNHLWRDRYRIEADKVPQGIIDRECVRPAFIVGKGINYIRRCLLDRSWGLGEAVSLVEVSDRLVLEDTHSMKSFIEKTASRVHAHIIQSLSADHDLMSHLYALKQFLLLGQGDFFSALMDGIHAEYEGQVGLAGVVRHSLAAIVDSALRSTNASDFASHILQRVQVELRIDKNDNARFMFGRNEDDTKAEDNRTVWDVFTLTYNIPDPLVAVIPARAMESYHRLFHFLFGIKKVEFFLNQTWRQSAVLQRAIHMAAQFQGINTSMSAAYSRANILLRRIAMTRQSMMHFVINLKSYLMFEVLEGSWKQLVQKVDEARTLDEIIEAHEDYLRIIVTKAMQSSDSNASTDLVLLGQKIGELLGVVTQFCNFQEILFGAALQAAERAALKRREAEQRLTQGDWGFVSHGEATEEFTFFGLSDHSKIEEITDLSETFRANVMELLDLMDRAVNGNGLSNIAATGSPSSTPSSPGVMTVVRQKQDNELDSLSLFIFQLDCNNYYATTSR